MKVDIAVIKQELKQINTALADISAMKEKVWAVPTLEKEILNHIHDDLRFQQKTDKTLAFLSKTIWFSSGVCVVIIALLKLVTHP